MRIHTDPPVIDPTPPAIEIDPAEPRDCGPTELGPSVDRLSSITSPDDIMIDPEMPPPMSLSLLLLPLSLLLPLLPVTRVVSPVCSTSEPDTDDCCCLADKLRSTSPPSSVNINEAVDSQIEPPDTPNDDPLDKRNDDDSEDAYSARNGDDIGIGIDIDMDISPDMPPEIDTDDVPPLLLLLLLLSYDVLSPPRSLNQEDPSSPDPDRIHTEPPDDGTAGDELDANDATVPSPPEIDTDTLS